VTAQVVIYEAFVEGKLEVPKHLARTVRDRLLRAEELWRFRAENNQASRPEIGWSACCTNTVQTVPRVLKNTPKCPATALIAQQHTQNWVDS
jgi:hypothetical protein